MKKIIIFLIFFIVQIQNLAISDTLIIQSTTSTRDSGLYKYLLPHYPDYKKIKIKVVAVGTGQAILNSKNCDGNILIVHDKSREIRFMQDGYGLKRHELMYNDFVVIGPKEDKLGITNSKSISDVFSKIYDYRQTFISRSDSSGTHSAEMTVWNNSKLDPSTYSGEWYLESGQGMGPSLNIAISMNGFIFSDRSSWMRFNNKRSHKILYSNPEELRNDYGMILVNYHRCSNLYPEHATRLYNWLSSNEAASLINNYRLYGAQVFYTP
tara:strand:- start:43 stop:843 length:801 start_codon:yes stop_codon:yes gene_type:complete